MLPCPNVTLYWIGVWHSSPHNFVILFPPPPLLSQMDPHQHLHFQLNHLQFQQAWPHITSRFSHTTHGAYIWIVWQAETCIVILGNQWFKCLFLPSIACKWSSYINWLLWLTKMFLLAHFSYARPSGPIHAIYLHYCRRSKAKRLFTSMHYLH